MNKIHNIWAVICFFMSLAFFVAGRWSVQPNTHQIAQPTSETAREREGNPAAPNKAGSLSPHAHTAASDHMSQGGAQKPQQRQSMEITSSEPPFTNPSSSQQASTDNASAELPDLALPQPTPEMITMQEKAYEDTKEAVADSLRNSGIPEDEIKRQLEEQFPPPAKIDPVPQEQSTEIPSEQLAEEVAASLRESGASEEEIDQALEALPLAAPEETERQ